MAAERSQVRPVPSPALGYPLQRWEGSSSATGIPSKPCVASALGLASCLKGTAKSFMLICLLTSVQTHPPISRETTVAISSWEISHGVKRSYQIAQKARHLHQAHHFCTTVVAAPGTLSHGVSWVIAVPRGYGLDKAPQILELNAAKFQ